MNCKVPIAVCVVSLILNIVGLATANWLHGTYSLGEIDYKAGLWRYCTNDECHGLRDRSVTGYLEAVRALEILGIVFLVFGLGCAFLEMLQKIKQDVLPKVAGVCTAIAGKCIIIGCIIFAAKYREDPYVTDDVALHVSFALCVIASAGSDVATVLFFMVKDRSFTRRPMPVQVLSYPPRY